MAGNPACERFIPQLSPYVDGELSAKERVHVERHLVACKDCTSRAADLRAESALLRVGLDMAVDEVDFRDFAQKVMARVTPERPPLLERWRLSLSELFLYHRTAMVSSLATAAVLALVVVPLLARQQQEVPLGYGGERMRVRAVSAASGAKVAPVVLEDNKGNTIIWVVDQEPPASEAVPPGTQDDDEALELDTRHDVDSKGKPVKPAAPGEPRPKGGAL